MSNVSTLNQCLTNGGHWFNIGKSLSWHQPLFVCMDQWDWQSLNWYNRVLMLAVNKLDPHWFEAWVSIDNDNALNICCVCELIFLSCKW